MAINENDTITYGASILLFEREYERALKENGGMRSYARKSAVVALMKAVRGIES